MGDIIIFALLAGFILSRLFKVLGDTSYDHEQSKEKKKHYEEIRKSMEEEFEESRKEMIKQIDVLSGMEAELSEQEREIFDEIRQVKPTFTADEFVEGAKAAFEMVIGAFSAHDGKTLKNLMDSKLYKVFEKEIKRREASKQRYDTTLVSIEDVKIESVKKDGKDAIIEVLFTTEQINVIRDLKTNDIIGGSTSTVKKLRDMWTFRKAIKSRDNMWQLIETERRD